MDLRQKVISGLRWSAAAKFLGQLITWGITIIVIRLLSPADYGLMELTTVFVTFLSMLSELGLGAAVIQKMDLDDETLRSIFGWILVASLVFYLSLALAGSPIASFYAEARLVLLIRVLALQFILMGFAVLPRSILIRNMEFRKIATIDFYSNISGSIITLALALNGQAVWALIWGSLMIRVVSVISLNVAQPFLHLPHFTIKKMGEIFSFSGLVTLWRILWYLYYRADSMIIGRLLGKELLGFYAVGLHLASLPMEKVSGLFNQVAFPAFSSMQSEEGMASRYFLKAVRVMSFCAFPVLLGISSLAPEIVNVFLGEKWRQAITPLQFIALAIPVRMISAVMHTALLGIGRPDILILNTVTAFLIMTGAFFVGCYWGLIGVSLSWCIIFPLVFTLNVRRSVKILEIEFSDVFSAMAKPIFCALFMYGCVFMAKMIFPEFDPILRLIVLTMCGVCSYSGIIFLSNREGFREVREITRL